MTYTHSQAEREQLNDARLSFAERLVLAVGWLGLFLALVGLGIIS